MEKAEVLECIMYTLMKLESAFGVLVVKSFLHVAEETMSTGDGKSHGVEFAKDLVPPLN